MNFVLTKLTNIFKFDNLISILKIGFDIKKIITLLLLLTVAYIVIGPTCILFKQLFKKNIKSNKSNKSTKTNETTKSYETDINQKKFRKITTDTTCSACNYKQSETSNSNKTKAIKIKPVNKKKICNVLRKFKITV